ncbi:MAG TPA: hypothetical protein VFW19_00950 [Allosphingosinicella sp.]|nr:hypothetical protein [Allosphingosinicella sp.]
MRTIAEWTIILYVALKVCHALFGPSARRTDAPLSARLRSGEPMLAIGVFGFGALLALYFIWFTHTFARHHYAYSTGCYPKLAAAHALPPGLRRYDAYDAAERARIYADQAEENGATLGIPVAAVDGKLRHDSRADSAYYAGITARRDRRAIAAAVADLNRCVKGIGGPRGEIFDP